MKIQSTQPRFTPSAPKAPAQTEPDSAQTITQRIVDATVDNTLAGTDRVASAFAGMGTGAAAYLSKMPSTALNVAKSVGNLYKAETIGPNIKVVAAIASPVLAGLAVAGAGLGLVASVGAGAVMGFGTHDADKPREFTIDKAVDKAWSKTRESVSETTGDWVKESAITRDEKLAPGEDPWDIPLPPFGRTAKTMAATVAGIVIGGVGGVATAIATTAKGAWSGIKQAVTDFSPTKGLAGLATVVASPVAGAIEGASKVFTTPVKAAAVAWKEKSLSGAVKAAVGEAFTADPSKLSNSVGSFAGATLTAVPSMVGNAAATTVKGLASGLKTTFADKDMSASERALNTVATVVGAPVSGLAHGVATGVATPFVGAVKGWQTDSLVEGVTQGTEVGASGTRGAGTFFGAAAGGLVTGVVSAVPATAAGLVRQVGGGVVDAATNRELNFKGKVLEGFGGIPGDAITAVGQGIGTVIGATGSSVSAVLEPSENDQSKYYTTAPGFKAAAQSGVKSVQAAANPNRMVNVEVVEAQA